MGEIKIPKEVNKAELLEERRNVIAEIKRLENEDILLQQEYTKCLEEMLEIIEELKEDIQDIQF